MTENKPMKTTPSDRDQRNNTATSFVTINALWRIGTRYISRAATEGDTNAKFHDETARKWPQETTNSTARVLRRAVMAAYIRDL